MDFFSELQNSTRNAGIEVKALRPDEPGAILRVDTSDVTMVRVELDIVDLVHPQVSASFNAVLESFSEYYQGYDKTADKLYTATFLLPSPDAASSLQNALAAVGLVAAS